MLELDNRHYLLTEGFITKYNPEVGDLVVGCITEV